MGLQTTFANLPTADQIQNGDYILMDNGIATQKLDFANFVVGLNNTTFASTISSNSANISSLQQSVSSLTAFTVASLSALSASTTTQINTASASILAGVQTYFFVATASPVIDCVQFPNLVVTFALVPGLTGFTPNNLIVNLSANVPYSVVINSAGIVNSVPTVNMNILSAGHAGPNVSTLSAIVYLSIFKPLP